MRIFITLNDESGLPRNIRMKLINCPTTSLLINEICRQLGAKKSAIIICLKYEPYNLRVVEGWPVEHYNIKNGSNFIVTFIEKYEYHELSESTSSLLHIPQQVDGSFSQSSKNGQSSMVSSKHERDDQFFQDCLKRMIQAIREGNLQKTASILNEEIQTQDQYQKNEVFRRKHEYLLNELGEEGKNSLHEAIQNNNIDIVSFLMIKGALPITVTIDDYTPLQLSIIHRSMEIANILLEQKLTDVNQNTSHGTALHLAISLSDSKAVQLLLKYEADVQVTNPDGKKPCQICSESKITQLLNKKVNLRKISVPTITIGFVFGVASFTKRLKQRLMTLNPFKQQLLIQIAKNQYQYKIPLTQIEQVRQIQQKSWLMDNELFYFNIITKSQEDNQITIALKNKKTYTKWLKNLSHTFKYLQNSVFNKPIPTSEHLIEIIDDKKNEITLRKRKVEQIKSTKMTMSIMNLRLSKNAQEPNTLIETITSSRSNQPRENIYGGQTFANEREFNQSTICLGSVLGEDKSSEKSEISENNQIVQVYEETLIEPQISERKIQETPTNINFRKNSEKIEYISEFKKEQKISICLKDFEVIKMLGNGSFGQVYSARYLKNNKLYALKVLNKKKLIAKKQLKYAVSEANILKKVNSPFIIKMYFAFQTPLNLYMAIDSCSNGDLSQVLVVRQRLAESTACFVIAQLIIAIQYLHKNRILYRDMKPENILIDNDGYIKLTDFGLSKQNNFSTSFCGSPAYLSPQMLQKKGVGFQSDIYGIGTVLFEMVVGDPPYFDDNMQIMFDNIKNGKLKYPSYLSIQIKSLLSKLLERDPTKRLGSKDINQVKKHDFFKYLDWNALIAKKLKVPSELLVKEEENSSQRFNLESSKQKLIIDETQYEEGSSNGMMSRIKNFTFVREQMAQKFNQVPIIQKMRKTSNC